MLSGLDAFQSIIIKIHSILISLRIQFWNLVGARLSFLLFFFLERIVGMRTEIRLTHLIWTLPLQWNLSLITFDIQNLLAFAFDIQNLLAFALTKL